MSPFPAHQYPTAWHIDLDGQTARLDAVDLVFAPQTISDEEYATLLAAIPLAEPTPEPGDAGVASPHAEEGRSSGFSALQN